MSRGETTMFRRGSPNPGFQPGRSGNPGGRPSEREISALARRYAPDIIRAWVDVCRNATDNPSARVAAANALADRGWGKPRQEVEVSGSMGQALHLHLYAVQRLEEARAVAADLEAPPIDGTAEDFSDVLLPPPLPEEALPLWDAMRERAADQPEDPPGEEPPPDPPSVEDAGRVKIGAGMRRP
jgi:hypothetical protein